METKNRNYDLRKLSKKYPNKWVALSQDHKSVIVVGNKLKEVASKTGKPVKFTGISGHINGFRLEKVKIQIEGIAKSVEIPVCFVDSPTVGLLLGQEGFFDNHRIKFEKDHDTFEIVPNY